MSTDRPDRPTTLVTGATGDIGSTLTALLSRGDLSFRVMCRRPGQIEAFRDRGVDAVLGDFTDPRSVRAALEGCEQLFLLPPFTPEMPEQSEAAIDAARDAGVRHVVKVSASDANPRSSVPWAADHGRVDAYLRQSGIAWTRLRAGAFMGGLLQLAPVIRRGVLPGISGHGATTWIDSADIAAAAERVLADPTRRGGPGADGHDHLLTGTQPLSFPQVATVLTEQLQRRVRYLALPAPLVYLGLRAARASRRDARGGIAQFHDVVRRGLDDVRVHTDDLTDLIGRPPVDMAAYVRQHRAELS